MNVQEILQCPACGNSLQYSDSTCRCSTCNQQYSKINGIFDFNIDERFEDEHDECKWLNEQNTGKFLVENYLIPLLKKLFPSRDPASIKVLSIGCGVGSDVDALTNAGYQCVGFDPGNRTTMWSKSKLPERYQVANAKHMPYANDTFDFAFMNCVLPHVGVQGDTQELKDTYDSERMMVVGEAVRVINKGGYIMLGSPNRLCPLDLFHRPNAEKHWPRLHSPGEKFLLSFEDHADYFVKRMKCQEVKALPISNYWGFFLSSRYAIGKVIQLFMKAYFALLSTPSAGFLRRSPLNPWLVTLVKK